MAKTIALHSFRSLRQGASLLRVSIIGAALLVAGTTALQNAVANGDTRTLSFHHTHRGEDATFTFKKDGRYDPAVLKKMDWYLRDWRNDKETKMDPRLYDILWEVYHDVGARAPINIVSSYRSPETNSMLHSRSRGVAKFSQHMLGKAMDFFIPGVKLYDLRVAGLRLQRGGVGFYPTSGSPFVHMDTGNIRHWPRMTHAQLAQVFPDGKTVHVPSDGRPLSHYAEALAEIRARGSDSGVKLASAKSKPLFAGLFSKKDEEDEAPEATPLPSGRPTETAAATLATQEIASATLLAPLPLKRPNELARAQERTQMAQLAPAPLPAVITRGTSAREDSPALGYAAPGDVFGPAPSYSLTAAPGRKAAKHQSQARAKTQPAGQANAQADAMPPKIAFGRLFLSPALSSELYLRTPEVRVFTAFVAAPREIVVSRFTRDPSFGLQARFSGTAVAYVPTQTFHATSFAFNQKM